MSLNPVAAIWGIVHRRGVTVGEFVSDNLEILEGLAEGDLVVTAGVSKIEDGLGGETALVVGGITMNLTRTAIEQNRVTIVVLNRRCLRRPPRLSNPAEGRGPGVCRPAGNGGYIFSRREPGAGREPGSPTDWRKGFRKSRNWRSSKVRPKRASPSFR